MTCIWRRMAMFLVVGSATAGLLLGFGCECDEDDDDDEEPVVTNEVQQVARRREEPPCAFFYSTPSNLRRSISWVTRQQMLECDAVPGAEQYVFTLCTVGRAEDFCSQYESGGPACGMSITQTGTYYAAVRAVDATACTSSPCEITFEVTSVPGP